MTNMLYFCAHTIVGISQSLALFLVHTHIGKINVNSTRIDGDNLCDDELLEWVTMNCFKDELEGTNCHVMV